MALVGDEGKTIRFPATALLTIDSEDRFKSAADKRSALGSSPYDFTISPGNGGRSILGGFIRRMGVSEVQFPWCVPNVNRQSNTMNVAWDGGGPAGTATITLDTGFYTPHELAAAIETEVSALSASLAGFTIQYSDSLNLPVFYYDTHNAFINVGFSPVPVSSTNNITSQTRQLFDLLGFTTLNITPFPSARGLSTFCQFTRYIDIECAQLVQ